MNQRDTSDAENLQLNGEANLKMSRKVMEPCLSPEDYCNLIRKLESQVEELTMAKNRSGIVSEKYYNFHQLASSAYFTLNKEGFLIEANPAGQKLLGLGKKELSNTRFEEFVSESTKSILRKFLILLNTSTASHYCELIIISEGKFPKSVSLNGILQENGAFILINCTETPLHTSAEYEQKEILRLITLINTAGDLHSALSALTSSLHTWTGCEAIGIRLNDEEDYPYYETSGFPPKFVHSETQLCSYGSDGNKLRDTTGRVLLDCMCGKVLQCRFDPSKPYFTSNGSFWSNNTTALLNTTREADSNTHIRNNCNKAGYESVALIPLRTDNHVFGLIQFNDHRFNRFNAELIAHFEKIADSLAIGLSRRQALESLHESEIRFKKISSISTDFAYSLKIISDGSFKLEWTTGAFEKITGFSPDEILGKIDGYKKLIHPDDQELAARHLKDSIRGIVSPSELKILTKSGEVKWISNTGIAEWDDIQHRVVRITGAAHEITQRKLTEAALLESEHKYRELIENSPDAITIYSEGKIVFVNGECLHLMAANSKEELLGRSVLDFVHPSSRKQMIVRLKQALMGSVPLAEEKFIRLDGSIVDVNVKAMPVSFDGRAAVQLIVRDISERKEAERNLMQSEIRLKSLVCILQYNANIKELLDFTLDEAVKLTDSKFGYIYFYNELENEFVLHSWSKNVMKEFKLSNPKSSYTLEETGIWGESVRKRSPIIINDFRILDEMNKGYPAGHTHLKRFLTIPVIINNEIVAVIGVANKETEYKEFDIMHLTLLMDNTWKTIEKKKIDEQVNIQNAELLKLNANMLRLMSILAHDLRNPFNALLGVSELLSKNIRSFEIDKIERQASMINVSAQRIYRLLEDILMWTRSQSGIITFEPEKLNLLQVYAELLDILKPGADSKMLTLTCAIPETLIVYADIEMLKTIIRNLISNAIKFTDKGGTIEFKAEEQADCILFSVLDSGIGMNPEIADQLFETEHIYTTAGTAQEKGTGLGLLLCKEFVLKHCGKIWAISKKGKGSQFHFTLPKSEK